MTHDECDVCYVCSATIMDDALIVSLEPKKRSHESNASRCILFSHLIHRYLSASAHHSVRCFVSSLFSSTKIQWFFGLGLSSSQSFHCSTSIASFRIDAFSFSSSQPVNNSFVVYMHFDGVL